MTKISSLILSGCYTKQQALLKLSEVKEVLIKGSFGGDGQELLEDSHAAEIVKVTEEIRGLGLKKLEEELEAAESEIEGIEPLTLFVAKEISGDQLTKLAEKARKLLERDILFDFRIDPGLIGGAKVAWQGRVADYSLAEIMRGKKAEIKTMVHTILK